MRPKLLALLAISVLALASCSSNEASETVAVPPSASAVSSSPAPTTVSDLTLDTDEATMIEIIFVDQAQASLQRNGVPEIDPEVLVNALHETCETGDPMNLSKVEFANESLENLAQSSCAQLER